MRTKKFVKKISRTKTKRWKEVEVMCIIQKRHRKAARKMKRLTEKNIESLTEILQMFNKSSKHHQKEGKKTSIIDEWRIWKFMINKKHHENLSFQVNDMNIFDMTQHKNYSGNNTMCDVLVSLWTTLGITFVPHLILAPLSLQKNLCQKTHLGTRVWWRVVIL